MTIGVRGRLFGIALLLISVFGIIAGGLVEYELRRWWLQRVESELIQRAQLTREAVELLPHFDYVSADALAHRLGNATSSRVSIIAPDGTLLGDSGLSLAEVAQAENHRDRPEVRQAAREGKGSAQRYSTSVETDMLYVAVPFHHEESRGFVRCAMPIREVHGMVGRLRMFLGLAGLVALIVAAFMSGLASHLLSRTLARLVENARALTRGEGHRIQISTTPELGHLAGSLNQLASELDRNVALLASERQRSQAVLESMSEAVIALDAAARITLVNPAALSLLGLSEQSEGRWLSEAVQVPALHALVQAGNAHTTTCEFTLADGTPRTVLARATPLRVGGTVVVMHDVTEIRRLETVRRDFVANVSHELRTPVSVIRANAETLLDGALTDPKASVGFLRAILRNSERLSRIIADLLDLARIEAGRYGVELTPVHLESAVRKTADALQQTARNKDIEIILRPLGTLKARADAKALDQVVFNLLDNAIKYSPSGARVVIRGETLPNHQVRLVIEDNGPGIDASHRSRVFERFYRVDPGRSREVGGTGLGLSIVKHLVEHMQGTVGVEGVSPTGSAFWFTLPGLASGDLTSSPESTAA